jgi:hypothetical protein
LRLGIVHNAALTFLRRKTAPPLVFALCLLKECHMRILSLAGCLLAFLIGYIGFHPADVFAQLPTPNPLILPPPAPAPPAPLRPIAPLPGIPSLAVVPTPSANVTPVSAGRIFDCSCFGPASPTHWMGRVAAPSYFGAQQAAVSACLAYNQNKEPQPPVVSAGQGQSAIPGQAASSGSATQFSAASGLVANQAALASALRAGQQLPSTTTFFGPQQLQACSRCACD